MPAASRTSAPASAVIAVIAALDFERKLLDDHAPADERSRVRVYQCGPGDAHAYDAARSALASGAAALVSWGVAGGLAPRSRAGDVVLPRRVLAATGMSFDADPVWRMELYRSLQAIFAVADGDLCSSPEVLGSSAAKSALAESTGAVAVDMESAAVARAAKAA
ncbi:MAG TPA: purine phosphorylase, partial [Gammaproteobacteria bacterium]